MERTVKWMIWITFEGTFSDHRYVKLEMGFVNNEKFGICLSQNQKTKETGSNRFGDNW
jgi:hypothetical protein